MDWDRPQRPFHTITLLAPPSGASSRHDNVTHILLTEPVVDRAVPSPVQRLVVFVLAAVALAALAPAGPAQAQAADAPAFAVGANKAYCHASDDSMQAWMNLLQDDGGGVPYNIFGEPAFVDPVQGIGFDPVQDEDFVVRIPLAPAATQGLVLSGTVNVQAFIGSGAYGGGQGTIAASLAVDGTEVGAAEAKDHTMQPHNSNLPEGAGPYEEITWTFEVPETTVPAGGLVEWVISGHIDFGNNIFLACHEARGRSNIDLPVTATTGGAPAGGGAGGNGTSNATSTVSVSSTNSTTSRSASSSASNTGTSTPSTSTTGNGTADEEQDTPAPSVAAATLAVVAAAAAVRRRLR